MADLIIFVQAHGRPGILEAKLPETATIGELEAALATLGITLDADNLFFVEDDDEPLKGERHEKIDRLKHGCRVHVTRCRHVSTTVHYLEKTAERCFPPGARVHAVKAWAARHFGVDHKDAAEHVLQLCNSVERPPSDTRLAQLLHGHHVCSLCFDLVPEKRVEG